MLFNTSFGDGITLKHRWQRFTQKLPIYTLAVMRWAKDYNNDGGCESTLVMARRKLMMKLMVVVVVM